MKRFNRFVPSLVLAIIAGFFLVLSSHAATRGQGRCAIHEQLTQEQRAVMHQRMLDLWSDGATEEQIHETITDMAKGYGIDVPDDCRHGHRGPGVLPMLGHGLGFGYGQGQGMRDLSQEQRAAVHQKMLELWRQGATPEEIHDGTAALLKGYGIEVPEQGRLSRGKRGFTGDQERFGRGMHGFGPGHGPGGRFMESLTDEQRAEVREEMEGLWEQGASPEEMHEAIAKKLQGYGVDIPEQGRRGRGMEEFGRSHGPGRFMQDLTDEQRAEVRAEMKNLWEQGASPDEMHEAIAKKLQGYGIDVPDQGRHGRGMRGSGKGFGPGHFMSELTTEQRIEVRNRMLTMWKAGSTPEEIHDAVDGLLKGYGIDVSESETGASAGENPDAVPGELRLSIEASPNPFREETVLMYGLPNEAYVKVDIFDLNGKAVRSFDIGHQTTGAHQLAWDGADDTGNPVTNGPYLCRVQADQYEATSRVMVIR